MRKHMVFACTFLLGSGLVLAQAPPADKTAPDTAKPSAAKPTSSNSNKKMDDAFAKKAAQGGMAEVELGKLAAEKATNPDVKAFGQRMVDDHTKAGDQLKGIASKEGLTLPTELSAKDKAQKERLSKLSGDAFDKAYINHMVMDHKKDVADFQKEANNGKDDEIKNFAQQTLPTLQDHLKQAQDAQGKVRGTTASTAKGADDSKKADASAKAPQ